MSWLDRKDRFREAAGIGALLLALLAAFVLLVHPLASAPGVGQVVQHAGAAASGIPAPTIQSLTTSTRVGAATFLDRVTAVKPGVWGVRVFYLLLGSAYLFGLAVLFAWVLDLSGHAKDSY